MNVCQLGKPEGRPPVTPGQRWEGNVIVTGKELGCEVCLYQLNGKFHWRPV